MYADAVPQQQHGGQGLVVRLPRYVDGLIVRTVSLTLPQVCSPSRPMHVWVWS